MTLLPFPLRFVNNQELHSHSCRNTWGNLNILVPVEWDEHKVTSVKSTKQLRLNSNNEVFCCGSACVSHVHLVSSIVSKVSLCNESLNACRGKRFSTTPVVWSRPVTVPAFVSWVLVLKERASPVRSPLESERDAVVVAMVFKRSYL